MSPSSNAAAREREEGTDAQSGRAVTIGLVGWFVPGAAHALLGQTAKGALFFVVLTGMFAIGLAFGGRLFPFQFAEWLVFLAALAQWGVGLPRLIAGMTGLGAGDVIAVTYEYGNTFLMAAGLLNALVLLDAVDVAKGRKPR